MFEAITLPRILGEDSTSNVALQIVAPNEGTYNKFDYLLFFDSRGLSTEDDDRSSSHLYLLAENLVKNHKSVLALSRPKNLTIFATLINFLKLNHKLRFKYLVTNMGFVDCTPKKKEFIEDILIQREKENNRDSIVFLEKYLLANKKFENLYTVDYSFEELEYIAEMLDKSFEKIYFLNTPEIAATQILERSRPKSFYERLKTSNQLIFNIAKNMKKSYIIDIASLEGDGKLSYDAVHYTSYGHQLIYKTIVDKII
ncbi:MAG: hypothetical protein IBX45_12840 [Campylobacterales bacterium]|nr:hypothetical protein [Campylobacterales bacterium]